MPKTNKPAAVDPTLETAEVMIKGKTYTLCFDIEALAQAEQELNLAGVPVNVLQIGPSINLHNTRMLFPIALRRFHPEIKYDEAQAMLSNLAWAMVAGNAIAEAVNKAFSEFQSFQQGEGSKNPT